MNSPFLCFLWSAGQKSHIRLGYERQVGKQQSLITITFVVAEHVADIWRERACNLSVEVSRARLECPICCLDDMKCLQYIDFKF